MPQLDSSFFASQFFWIVTCFSIFYAFMHFLVVPRISSIINHRNNINEKNTTTANMLSLQIAELKADAHLRSLKMQDEVNKLKSKFDKEFQEYTKTALEKFNDELKNAHIATMKELEDHKKIIKSEEIEKYVEDLAGKVIVKLTGMKTN